VTGGTKRQVKNTADERGIKESVVESIGAELEAPVQALAAVPSVAPITYHVENSQQLGLIRE
jgi:hypothetical protein